MDGRILNGPARTFVAAVKVDGLSRRAAAPRFGNQRQRGDRVAEAGGTDGQRGARRVGGYKPKKISGAWRDWLVERCHDGAADGYRRSNRGCRPMRSSAPLCC